jgi:hypothetical protein
VPKIGKTDTMLDARCMSLAGSNFNQHFYVASKDGNMSYWVVHQQEFWD